MSRFLALAIFLLVQPAQATTEPRCGIDAFGNRVCIDKDGVLGPAPRLMEDDQRGKAAEHKTDGTEDDAQQARPRCAVDSFGNTVCLK